MSQQNEQQRNIYKLVHNDKNTELKLIKVEAERL